MSERLPTVGSASTGPGLESPGQGPSPGTAGAGSDPGPAGASPAPKPRASSFKLVTTLAVAGGVAGFFIVLVHLWSQPRIEAYQARVLGEAVQEVLGGPETTGTFFLHEGAFTASPPASADTASLDRIYVGWDEGGAPVGIAAAAGEPGFQDIIGLIFGFDPGSGDVLGMKVLESKETPGLGDKIIKDSAFVRQFRGVGTPLEGVKPGMGSGADNEVDMITGATISAQAVVDIINNRVAALEGALEALWAEGVPAVSVAASRASEASPAPSVSPTATASAGASGAAGPPAPPTSGAGS